MRIALIGTPGSGKGTQARRLSAALELRSVGTGEIIRRAIREGTELGRIAAPLIDAGQFISDELADEIVRTELSAGESFLLDGYPRTIAQAEWFDGWSKSHSLALDAVVDLTIPDDEAIRRILGRRVSSDRADDTEATVRTRLAIYHPLQGPIREFYRRAGILIEISALAPVDTITERILNSLSHSHRPERESIVPCFNGTTINPPS